MMENNTRLSNMIPRIVQQKQQQSKCTESTRIENTSTATIMATVETTTIPITTTTSCCSFLRRRRENYSTNKQQKSLERYNRSVFFSLFIVWGFVSIWMGDHDIRPNNNKSRFGNSFFFVQAQQNTTTSTGAATSAGAPTCGCSPRMYTFTFQLNQTCETNNFIGLADFGIQTTECKIAPFQDGNTTDLVPVTVDSIDILELDEDLILLARTSQFGTYRTGDTFQYTSISNNITTQPIATTENTTSPEPSKTSIPKALQMRFLGQNTAGEAILFAALIIYYTDCSVVPTIIPGSSIGWITVTETTDPLPEFCPIIDGNTIPPIMNIIPTVAPSVVVSTSPVVGGVPIAVTPTPVVSPMIPTTGAVPTSTTSIPTRFPSSRITQSPNSSALSTKSPSNQQRSTKSPSTKLNIPTQSPLQSVSIPPVIIDCATSSSKVKGGKGKGSSSSNTGGGLRFVKLDGTNQFYVDLFRNPTSTTTTVIECGEDSSSSSGKGKSKSSKKEKSNKSSSKKEKDGKGHGAKYRYDSPEAYLFYYPPPPVLTPTAAMPYSSSRNGQPHHNIVTLEPSSSSSHRLEPSQQTYPSQKDSSMDNNPRDSKSGENVLSDQFTVHLEDDNPSVTTSSDTTSTSTTDVYSQNQPHQSSSPFKTMKDAIGLIIFLVIVVTIGTVCFVVVGLRQYHQQRQHEEQQQKQQQPEKQQQQQQQKIWSIKKGYSILRK